MIARLRDSAGFTLIEVLVAAVISLALGIGGFSFFRTQARSLTDQSASLDAAEGTRAALDFMAYDIRMAGNNPAGTWTQSGTCEAGLKSAQTSDLTISWDGANGGVVDGSIAAGETTRYHYDYATKSIIRTVDGADQTLIKNVPSGGLSFQYFVGTAAAAMSGGAVSSSDCNRVTNILITVQVQTARGTTVTNVNLGSRVALRNRKDVLKRL
jgi:prepilin-type N-terminal cleavage/methylation domain-containing protein